MKRISIFLIAVILISGLLSCSDGSHPDGYPDIPEDAVLAVDQPIGSIDVEYWERVVDDVFHVLNDYILIHMDPDTGEIIKCEQQWRDIDVDLANLEVEPFEPPRGEYFWERVAVFLEEEDTGDFYTVSNSTQYPLVCWETRYSDGTTAIYDLDGSEIGHGIPAPRDGLSLSGYHDSSNPDGYSRFREYAHHWFSEWSDSAFSLSLPSPATISEHVSDPDIQFYYAIAHGWSDHFSADGALSFYWASDAEADMQDRDPMLFAFVGHCEGMSETGSGSFSHAFRKGSMANTVTVGYSGMASSSGWPVHAFTWQNFMFQRMDEGHTIRDAFDLACAEYPLIADDVVFVGDPNLTLPTGVDSYDLTITSTSGGSISTPGEGTYAYAAGTAVPIVATPDTGYQFVDWTGDNVETIDDVYDASTTITMNDDYSINANFAEEGKVYLTISSTDGGSVTTPEEGTHAYDAGTVVDLVAEAQETDYEPCYFVNWSGNVDTVADVNAPTTTITMNDNYSITANFASDNIAFGKPTVASSTWTGYPPENAVDGSLYYWNSGDFPPGWIEVDLQTACTIGRIRLTVMQNPVVAETVHRVLGKGPGTGGDFQLLHEFHGITENNEQLEYTPAAPWEDIQFIRILTLESPSWVAWREIEIWQP